MQKTSDLCSEHVPQIKPFTLRYITGHRGTEGLYLIEADLYMLYFLYLQREVSQSQLNRFYNLFIDAASSTFRGKLIRLEKEQLIAKYSIALARSEKRNLVTLGKKGFDLLKRVGWIEEEDNKQLFTGRRNYDHSIGTKEVVLQILEEERAAGYLFGGGEKGHLFKSFPQQQKVKRKTLIMNASRGKLPFSHTDEEIRSYIHSCIPSSFPASNYERMLDELPCKEVNEFEGRIRADPHEHTFEENKNLVMFGDEYSNIPDNRLYILDPLEDPLFFRNKEDIILMPDATFKLNCHRIHIELDARTEKIKRGKRDSAQTTSLEMKFEKYDKLAKEHPNIHHHVIFVQLDNTIDLTRQYGKGDRRVRNLKKEMLKVGELKSLTNIDVYFLSLERLREVSSSLIRSLRSGKGWVDQTVYSLKLIRSYLDRMTGYNRESIFVKWESFLNQSTSKYSDYEQPGVLVTRKKDAHPNFKTIIPVFMREGNMKDEERLRYFASRAKELRIVLNKKDIRAERIDTEIWAIYETKAQMDEDILRFDIDYDDVFFVNIEEMQTERKTPLLYKGKERSRIPYVDKQETH
ncbi:hypothetical protein [Pseudobacillus badius]|uniref:hypothetical protein n=1 Tax=Bacillus badius TaxID=1455 RepID=UPI003D34DF8A